MRKIILNADKIEQNKNFVQSRVDQFPEMAVFPPMYSQVLVAMTILRLCTFFIMLFIYRFCSASFVGIDFV